MTENLKEYITYYLNHLDGPEADNAFYSLIDTPKKAIPLLVDAYFQETRPSIRAAIVEVVWQHWDPTTVPFLATALREDSEEIWKEALDGLVAIGNGIALETLRSEKGRVPI